jgi:carbon-monoxide dehydrogenase large subunit
LPPAVGRRIRSLATPPLVAGRGTFIGDLDVPGTVWLAVLRSPYPHALIRAVDASPARRMPGVLWALTGAEAAATLRPIPSGADAGAMGARDLDWHALAVDRVRYAGEAVAAVVAEDRAAARAALDAIEVEYEELPVVADPESALDPGAPQIVPGWPDNVRLRHQFVAGDTRIALAAAGARTVAGHLRLHRITGVPIEARGCLAVPDAGTGLLTYWDATQQPHVLRTFLAEALGVREGRIRVRTPNVGGAFGMKQPLYQEQVLVAYAALALGRPVKWLEERAESLLAGGHARDTRFEYEAAYELDGRVTALRARVVADVGAPTSLLGWTMAFVTAYHLPSAYDVPNLEVELLAVSTNTCPWVPYRGFGKDAACFLMDRVMDHVARETGLDGAAVRRRNYIPHDAFPYARPGGAILDSGDYPAVLDRLLERVDVPAFRRAQSEARALGRHIGLGIGQELTPEGVAIPGSLMNSAWDGATIRIAPSGEVTVLAGVTSPGSGNETALAQIAADALGCRLEVVRVLQGDTEACPYGLGNYSSRSVMLGGSAVQLAAGDLRAKLDAVAASLLGGGNEAVEAGDGRFWVAGAGDREVAFEAVVDEVYRHTFGRHAEGVEPGLEATRYFRIGNIYHQPETQGRFSTYPTWPNGAAAAVVEVDPETGVVRLLRYVLVEDAGTIVNPLLADANLHGGIAQGIGSALFEAVAYDRDGQLLTGTLMDYTIPTAVEVPKLEIEHHSTPSPFTPLGTKGVGESGLSSAAGAIAAAIEDAFPELDLRLTELPLTPARVWRAIRGAAPKPSTPGSRRGDDDSRRASDARPAEVRP